MKLLSAGRGRLKYSPACQLRICTAEDLIVYKIVSLRLQDRVDVEGIIRRQDDQLDDIYVEDWLRQFEQALDDSTLIVEYRRLRERFSQ